MWKGNGNATILLFSLKGLEILLRERRGQVSAIAMERFNAILFHNSTTSDNPSVNCVTRYSCQLRCG